MAVRHINPNAKEESGIFVSGEDAEKVFSMFFGKRDKEEVKRKKENLHSHFVKAIKTAENFSK